MTGNNHLSKRRCEACAPGTIPLDATAARELHKQLDASWELADTKIRRTFDYRNFRDAFAFATRVALLAEDQGHHPDITIGWSYCTVELTTHAAKGLTENDFIMAAKIDRFTTG